MDSSQRIHLPAFGWAAVFLCTSLCIAGVEAGAQEWKQSWNEVAAAAAKEGKVVVSGPTGAARRQIITEGFQAEFPDISVDYSGLPGREIIPRIIEERRFGRKLWDVIIGGPSSLRALRDADGLVDLRQAFILPQVKGNDYWYGGTDFGFVDTGRKYVFAFSNSLVVTGWVNHSFIGPTEFNDPRQLIDPKFKGKIALDDPRTPGPGSLRLASFLRAYGEKFVEELLTKQDVVVIRNWNQLAEWLVRGRYPIAIGPTPAHLQRFFQQGLGKNIGMLMSPETTIMTAEVGNIAFVEGAPHPNAAKLFVNWILSKGPQQTWADVTANNSRRKDVTPSDLTTFPIPERLRDYTLDDEEFRVVSVEKAREMAKKLLSTR